VVVPVPHSTLNVREQTVLDNSGERVVQRALPGSPRSTARWTARLEAQALERRPAIARLGWRIGLPEREEPRVRPGRSRLPRFGEAQMI